MTEKQMAYSPRQHFNRQRVSKISGFGIQFRSWNVGSIFRRGTEIREELRKRKVDVRCFQKVRWRGHRAQFLGVDQ